MAAYVGQAGAMGKGISKFRRLSHAHRVAGTVRRTRRCHAKVFI
ncbi:hypothetical protein [Sphingobium sp. HWE2-09]|nr:hypothetical protein [Sphingobium sp. HWE2-09]